MVKLTKRQKQFQNIVDKNKIYSLEEAMACLKKVPPVKFNETVDISFKLNADPKQSDQMVRGTVVLPHGTGKKVRIVVLCKGEVVHQAKSAGADFVGDDELIAKINSGWLDFDVVISSPDMMKEVGKLGKVLGPRGLMPNPKTGTVTNDIVHAVKESKAGKVEFKLDKLGNINLGIGKISFDEKSLCENAGILIEAVHMVRPRGIKGKFIKRVSVSTTMGPSLRLDIVKLGVS